MIGNFEVVAYVDKGPANAQEAFKKLAAQFADSKADRLYLKNDIVIEREEDILGDDTITVYRTRESDGRNLPLFKMTANYAWLKWAGGKDQFSAKYFNSDWENVTIQASMRTHPGQAAYLPLDSLRDYSEIFGLGAMKAILLLAE